MIIDSAIVTGSLQVSGSLNVSVSSSAKTFFGSGSSQFGYSVTDVQTMYGIVDVKNGPVLVTGSLNVANRITVGELTVLYGITGSIAGTASYVEFAQSASLALSAETAISASHANTSNTTISSSYALQAQTANTASLASIANTASYVSLAESASYVQVAQTASYVTLAQTASYVLTAQNANTASYVLNAQSASYVLQAENAYSASIAALAINANTASYVTLAQTASYVLTAQSASHALFAISASNAQTASSAAGNFVVNGIMGVGGPANGLYQVYVTTSLNDGTFALDSSADYNAMYFLKGGLKKFEISTAGDGTPITQIVPYTSSGIFRIGNPSNASTDYILLSEPTGGRVILGPGISDTTLALSGSQNTDLVQFTGNTFVSGTLTVFNNIDVQEGIASVGGFTGSLQGTADTASYVALAQTATSASYALSSSFAVSSSFAELANNATLFNSLSSSQFPQVVQNNTFTGTQYISNTTNATSFVSTAALYTDGGLRVSKDSFISGGLSIAGNLTVFGTSSVNYITSSVLVGLEFINLNTDLPALRYAGINVGDSGSAAGISSSFWYDSAKDNWIFVYAPAGSSQQTSSLAINGPIAYNNVGSEQGLLGNYVVKSQLITADNNHHITSSQIYDDGTTVAIAGNLQVTGSLRAGNTQLNSLGVGTAGSGTAGEIRATADVTAFYSSDERLKGDITPIENPIEKLMAINGVTFNWKEGFDEVHSHKGADTGVIAQQIEAIGLPEIVTTRDNGYKAVNYEKLNALLIEGFKAQQAQLDAQKLEIEELKAKLK